MYSVHKSMTKDRCKTYIKGDFKQFIALFDSIKYYMEKDKFPRSLFSLDGKSEFHASIIEFNGVGFICKNKHTWRKVKKYVKKFIEDGSRIYPCKHNVSRKLNKLLEDKCCDIGIPVEYVDNIRKENLEKGLTVYGQIQYHSRNNIPLFDNARILIKDSIKSNPAVLAHEIGHYIAINNHRDYSEEGADSRAYELCEELLTKKEMYVMMDMLNIFISKGDIR